MRSSDFVNHSYDYRPNWTPLSPVTITYVPNLNFKASCLVRINLLFQRKPFHSQYFPIALLLHFSVLLSWFQPVFVLFVAISAILCHCFKVMSLSEFYPNRAPFRLRVVPHFFSGVIFTRARVSLALLSLRKNGELLVV